MEITNPLRIEIQNLSNSSYRQLIEFESLWKSEKEYIKENNKYLYCFLKDLVDEIITKYNDTLELRNLRTCKVVLKKLSQEEIKEIHFMFKTIFNFLSKRRLDNESDI